MNKILCFLLTFIVSFIVLYIEIWWIVAIPVAIIHFFLGKSSKGSFFTGFIGVFLAWFIFTFIINILNDSIMADRIAEIFHLEKPILLIIITSLVGGLVGGLSAITGFSFQNRISFKRKTKGRYS